MNVEFTNRAVRDLHEISGYTRGQFGDRIAAALEGRMREIVAQITSARESAAGVEQRPGVRVVPLGRYPFRVFYRVVGDTVRIMQIRHTARRPW